MSFNIFHSKFSNFPWDFHSFIEVFRQKTYLSSKNVSFDQSREIIFTIWIRMKCVQQPSSRGKSKNPEGRNNCIEGTNSLFCKQHLLGHLKIGFNFVCQSSIGDWFLKVVGNSSLSCMKILLWLQAGIEVGHIGRRREHRYGDIKNSKVPIKISNIAAVSFAHQLTEFERRHGNCVPVFLSNLRSHLNICFKEHMFRKWFFS